jgi:hypothetical protein
MSVTERPRTIKVPERAPAGPASRWAYLRYLLIIGVVAAVAFVSVGVANTRLNPYVYDGGAIDSVAADMAAGKNFANYDPNIDLRALRKAQIQHMTSAPDVIFFGGSRWQEARSSLVPGGHTVFNAYVSNDQVEDMLALTYILDRAGRLPKTLVFSLRFVSLQPVAERDTYDWKVWGPEYAAMSEWLGVSPVSYYDRMPIQQWAGTFNLPALYGRVQQLNHAKSTPTTTTADQTRDLDIIAADGSLHWSRNSEAKFTRKFVDKAVEAEILRSGNTQPAIDPSLVNLMGKLIDWLKAKGVRVMVIQTPYHPVYWQKIQAYPFAKTLHGLEAVAVDLAAKHGSIAGGHYDPKDYPHCVPENFVDHIHPRPPCLADMFRQLPDLVTGAPQ